MSGACTHVSTQHVTKLTGFQPLCRARLQIDISELELPYIPKQVLDCVFIESLIADRNLLDEV